MHDEQAPAKRVPSHAAKLEWIDTDELKRKSAHQLMQLSQLLMARDQELEELNEMVSLLKSQMDISAEDAKEALKAIEAHVRATEGKLQQAVREIEVLKQGEKAAEQSMAEAIAAAATKAIAAAENRAMDAAADAADAVAAAEEGAAKAIAAAEIRADEEIQEVKEKAEELVRQAKAEAAALRGDLEKVQSSAQISQEQQNKLLKQSEERVKHEQERVRQEQERVAQMERRVEDERQQTEKVRKHLRTEQSKEAAAAQAMAQAVQSVRGQLEEKLEVTLSAKNAQIDALRLELNQAARSAQVETMRLELSQTTQIDALRLQLAQAEARHASASRLLEARVVQVMEDAAYEVASVLVDAAHSDAREAVKLGLLEAQEAALRLARQLDVALGRAPLAEAKLITQFERADAALLMPAGSGHIFLAHKNHTVQQSHTVLVHKMGKEMDEGDGLPETLVFQSMKVTRLTPRRASLDFEAEGVPSESVVAAAIPSTAAASADTEPASVGPSPGWSTAAADRLRSETVDAQPSGLNLPSARAIDWGDPSDDEVGDETYSHATQKKNATRLGDLEAAQIELAQRNAMRLADAQAAKIEATWAAQRNAERITIATQRNAARMSELRAALAQAVEAEDYDRAAELQPQVHELRLATIELATREGAAVAATAPPAASSVAGVKVATVAEEKVVPKPKPLDKVPVQTRSTLARCLTMARVKEQDWRY